MKREIIPMAAAAALVLSLLIGANAWMVSHADPNETMKKNAAEAVLGEPCSVAYEHSSDSRETSEVRAFKFTADESTEYDFALENIEGDEGVILMLHVVDEDMSEYLVSGDQRQNPGDDRFHGSAFITKGQTCYAVIEAYPEQQAEGDFAGSYIFTVSKAADIERPAELMEGETLSLTLKKNQQTCAHFVPEETSYYDFETEIVSIDRSSAFSSVTEITAEDQQDIVNADGICRLEGGRDYYVWIGVFESSKKKSEVRLSVRRLESVEAEGECVLDIRGRTLVEFTASEDGPVMISSVSDGDPESAVYDSDGFMISADNDSGGEVSGNENDFALGFNAERGKTYLVCVDGKFTECEVTIQKYTGDGESPTPVRNPNRRS